ncbi:glycosyltransferase family 2 protein [Desulfosoma caldarium]|uniref:GT2 family glycosyltransferase n=1 Tax=Desulfosoma caldarium TaxID=610254 RepID=A0A3N1UPU1_9BACT|nr:glycosyltransferase [Desulfosoma caldarium]ROQ90770.1 GT2 family glycosyltransferase [Desulfosoma caldarium]
MDVDFVSIIIPVFNQCDFTRQCIQSLFANVSYSHFEVIVVDNHSTDETPVFLNWAQSRYGIRVIRNDRNLGFAKACNQGGAVAQGSLLLFLKNDVLARPGWLEPMVDVLREDLRVGVVGPMLLYPDETIQHAGIVIADAPAPLYPAHVYRGRPKDFPPANMQRDFQAVTGACMLVRKGVFQQVEGFDETYVNGCEDVDLCFKARRMGWRVVYTPKSVLVHFESVSAGKFDHSGENLILLNRRWAGEITPDYHLRLPRVSIVVLNYNGTRDTIECLQSLYGYDETAGARPENGLYYKPFQTIVVDNGSDSKALEALKAWLVASGLPHQIASLGMNKRGSTPFRQEIVLLESSENLGFSGGCNAGTVHALSSGADYVWILNNDTVVDPLALWNSVAFFLHACRSGMRVGAVGSKLLDYHHPERVQFDGDRVCYEGIQGPRGSEAEKIGFKTYVSGASMLLARKALEECGAFDEAFFLYFEDNDLCLRLNNAGWRVAFHPRSIVYHKGGASIGDWIGSPLSIYYATRNFLLFQAKHRLVDAHAFQMLRTQIWGPMRKDKRSIRAFLKGVSDFVSGRFGKMALETILEDWMLEKASSRQGIPLSVLRRFEDVLTRNSNGQQALETLLDIALAAYRKSIETNGSSLSGIFSAPSGSRNLAALLSREAGTR